MKRALITYQHENKIAPYAEALRSVGIEPVFASPDKPADSLKGAGLLLSGGADIDPALYGAERMNGSDQPDRARDALELRLVREALDRDLPVLAICRGSQMFNVAHSGTLIQHIDGHRIPQHQVTVDAQSRLAKILGEGPRVVNSRHHQLVGSLGAGLHVSARAADGVIEGIERRDRRFAVAVQWHPEDLFAQERALFEAFAAAL